MLLFRKLLPFSRITIVLWAWRNRASVTEWAAFALRTLQSATSGGGLDDAKAEFRLRANLTRDRRTRGALIDVAVEKGVARLMGRVSPEVHAAVQDIAVGTPGIVRIDDRITHGLGKAGLLKRKSKAA